MKKIIFCVMGMAVGLPVLALVGFQILQILHEQKGVRTMRGVVLDQEEQPIPGVEVTFRNWTRRWFVPVPFTPDRIVEKPVKGVTDSRGIFTVRLRFENTDFVSASKPGYRQDGSVTDPTWGPPPAGAGLQWTLHLVDEALMRRDQVRHWEVDSLAFPPDGKISVNLVEGKVGGGGGGDVTFCWQRLPASATHGEYGKFTIRAQDGGVWLWEQERLFAPLGGYEDGIVFFFKPKSFRAYMKLRWAEFFLKSRGGQVYARVFVQLDITKNTLSARVRANATGNRFVDAKSETYKIGVYSSLSVDYPNPDFPWWITIPTTRGQPLLRDDRIKSFIQNDRHDLSFHRYFAGYYKTPPDILKGMITSNLLADHYIPRNLAENLAAPPQLLKELAEKGPAWQVQTAQASLATPEDLRQFLSDWECP